MKRNRPKQGLVLLVLLAMLAALLPAAVAAEGTLFVTGYTVTNSSGSSVSSISRGSTVDITVSLKDTGSSSGDLSTLDVTKLEDSFTGGTASVQKTSEDGRPLTYAVKLSGLQYKGVGQSLKLQVGTAGAPDSYQTLEVTITEAVVYEKPQILPDSPAEAAPTPMVLIQYSELDKPLEAGQEATLTVTFRNLSNLRLKSPIATFTPTDGLSIIGGASSFSLDDIGGQKTGTVKVKVKAASVISSPAQSLGVELKFNYFNNIAQTQGSATEKIPVPALARESVPQPVVLVTRTPLAQPIASGESAEVTIRFQNTSTTKLVNPVVSVTPSDSLMLLNDAATFLLGDIDPGRDAAVTVRIKAVGAVSSNTQSLSTELKYSYDNGGVLTQATASDRLLIPAVAKQAVPQPVVLLTRSELNRPISPGESMDVTLFFQNAGSTKLVAPSVTVSPSDSLVLLNPTSTFLLGDIAPGDTASVALQIKAAKDLSSATQSLSTELKYSYDNGETMTQATSSDKVNISANLTAKGDTPSPNIVIRKYTYGESSVAAGSKFPLSFAFENTGTIGIENIVVTVDGGENFTMDGSTNTFYYKALPAGGAQTQEVPMRSVPAAKSGAQSISVSFKYEYMDGEKRTQATSDIKISVPIYQPDRFQITAPTVPESVNVGEEAELLLPYVNKGKDDLANLEATVVGDGVDTPARTQYLGNITAGTNGNIGFALSPVSEGDIELVLKISYEDADQQVQTREFPVTLHAVEPPPPVDFDDMDAQSDAASPPWLLLAGGAGALVLAVGGFLLMRRWRARRAESDTGAWDDWEDDKPEGGGNA